MSEITEELEALSFDVDNNPKKLVNYESFNKINEVTWRNNYH